YFDEREKIKVEYVVRGSIIGWLIAFIAGVGSGMLGIGGGFLKVSAMNLFMNIPLKVAIATSKFMICITAATSAVIYYVSGVVRLDLVAPLAVGTTIGATLGSRVMNKFKIKWLKLIFAFIMFYLGYAMLRKGLLLIFGLSLP
ncbi:MAG: sulfite exporter TauE/SafE family protein, partial [Thermoprotei archaeon]